MEDRMPITMRQLLLIFIIAACILLYFIGSLALIPAALIAVFAAVVAFVA
jgi:hypothetical protein